MLDQIKFKRTFFASLHLIWIKKKTFFIIGASNSCIYLCTYPVQQTNHIMLSSLGKLPWNEAWKYRYSSQERQDLFEPTKSLSSFQLSCDKVEDKWFIYKLKLMEGKFTSALHTCQVTQYISSLNPETLSRFD